MDGLLRIGQLAAAAGVSTRTIDFYTGLGLLSAVERSDAGYRLYPASAVDVIATIQQLEAHGVGLDRIAGAFSAPVADVAEVVQRLDSDLDSLRSAVEAAGPQARVLLAVLGGHADSLIRAAIDLATSKTAAV
jgi:MerR family transcriptional regulator, copper efflux regulator